MRQFKKKFKLNKTKNKLLNKGSKKINKLFPVLITILIISVSCSVTQAYFNNKMDVSSILANGNNVSNLSIKNGKVNLNFGAMPTEWNVSDKDLTKTVTDFEMVVNDPSKDSSVTYEGVTLKSNTNLTTNVDLSLDYSINKVGGTNEDSEGSSEPKTLQGFEVIVGDIDNLNYGWKGITKTDSYYSGTYDVYSGDIYNRNEAFMKVNNIPDRGLRPLPQGYDAPGTDRRMVISSFYDFFNDSSRLNGKLGTKNVNSEWNALGTVNYTTGGGNWGNGYDYQLEKYNKIWIANDSRNYYYDGYTNRTLRGEWGSDGSSGTEVQAKYDGLDWRYTQKVQPITFKYGEIPDDEAINSVCFQVFVDDLQASNEKVEADYFPHDSIASYKAYLKVAGESEDKKIQVSSWSNILNAVNQKVPAGNIVTLSLPMNDGNYDEYMSIIRRASGLNKGLQLIIDDPDNIAGDSYCIDFAKMTVNAEASLPDSQLITASGTVYDLNMKALAGVTVTSGDGRSCVTDKDGNFSFKVAKGFINIKASKIGKKDDYFISTQSITSDIKDIALRLADDPNYNGGVIKAQDKIGIQMIVDQYRDDNATNTDLDSLLIDVPDQANTKSELVKVDGKDVIRTTITYNDIKSTKVSATQALCSLGLKPGYEYKIKYVLSLKTAQEIGDLAGFKLEFTSNLKAKATQENNPAWSVFGDGTRYVSKYVAKEIEEGSKPDEPTTTSDGIFTNKTPEIYFETPIRTSEDTCGDSFWENSKPTIKMGTSSSNPGQAEPNTRLQGVQLVDNTSTWYKVNSSSGDSIPKNSIIKVESANGQTSGNLYYFSTNKIFICTNGENKSKVNVKFTTEDGQILSYDFYGKAGTTRKITCPMIEKDGSYYVPEYEYTFNLSFGETDSSYTVANFKYKKYNGVTIKVPASNWLDQGLYIWCGTKALNGEFSSNQKIPSNWTKDYDKKYVIIPPEIKGIYEEIGIKFHNYNDLWSEDIIIPVKAKTVEIRGYNNFEITESY